MACQMPRKPERTRKYLFIDHLIRSNPAITFGEAIEEGKRQLPHVTFSPQYFYEVKSKINYDSHYPSMCKECYERLSKLKSQPLYGDDLIVEINALIEFFGVEIFKDQVQKHYNLTKVSPLIRSKLS